MSEIAQKLHPNMQIYMIFSILTNESINIVVIN